ncbi:hypothetical protein HQ587_07050 [bacterium]|nr:hypothetical protein [bacterium]
MNVLKRIMWLTTVLFLLGITTSASAYDIELRFLSGNPMIFPLGPFIPDDLSNASDINFGQFESFFEMRVSGGENSDAFQVLFVRLQRRDEILFTVTSSKFDVSSTLLGRGWLDNRELSMIPQIGHGDGSQVNAGRLMPFFDGGNLSQGLYILTLMFSSHSDWNTALGDNSGIISGSIQVYNPSRVDLIEPMDNTIIGEKPIFVWSFPTEAGVEYHLDIVSGDEDDDPGTVIEFANPTNTYASLLIEPEDWQIGGNLASFPYIGIGEQRPLDPELTYYWRIIAKAPSMFPHQEIEIFSPIYRFLYSPGGNGDGGDLGGEEENPPPSVEDPLFDILRTHLTEAQIATLISMLGDLSQWSPTLLSLDNREITQQVLTDLLAEGEIRIVLVTVSE